MTEFTTGHLLIQREDARDVEVRQFYGSDFAGGHVRLELGNGGLIKFGWTRVVVLRCRQGREQQSRKKESAHGW